MGQADYFVHPSAEVAPDAAIGPGTRIWHGAQVREGAVIGANCVLGKGVYVDRGVCIGNGVRIQNGVSIYAGVQVEDDVFIGPEVTFTNDRHPRAFAGSWELVPTLVRRGASIGANATIVCGVTIGEYAMVGAGAVVTRDVPPFAMVYGNPARVMGRVDRRGRRVRGAADQGHSPAPPAARAGLSSRNGLQAADGRVRFGVIGAGEMGRNHVRVLLSLGEDAVVMGVADPDPAALARAREEYGVAGYADHAALLPLVDAVVIAAPAACHAALAMECLAAGKHVLVEKPMAATLAEAEELARRAEASGRVFMVGHVERFNPVVEMLEGALAGVGRIIGVQARRLSPWNGRGTDVDVVADLMVHDLDLVRALLHGSVARCQAGGVRGPSGLADFAAATLVFDGGAVAALVASRLTAEKVRCLEVTAEKGYVRADLLERKLFVTRGSRALHEGDGAYRQESVVEKVFIPNGEPLRAELAHFIACVRGGERPRVGAAEGLEAMRLVAAIQEGMAGVDAVRARPA